MTLAVGGVNKSAAFNYNAADVTHLKLHQSLSTFGHHDHIAEREHCFFIKSPALSIYRYAKTKAHISHTVTMLLISWRFLFHKNQLENQIIISFLRHLACLFDTISLILGDLALQFLFKRQPRIRATVLVRLK